MGLFDLFKKAKKIQDDFFGELTFIESRRKPSKSYFAGSVWFVPIEGKIECFVTADANGPTKEQRAFYSEIEARYDELVKKAMPLIVDEFRNWKDGFEILNFDEEFTPVSLTIPRLSEKELIWDMSFETIHDEDHVITVNFKGFEADFIMIDG